MPGGDQTGPMGTGSRSGRRAGYCAGNDAPEFTNLVSGYGMQPGGRNRGRSGGRGWRHRFFASGLPFWKRPGNIPPVPVQELGSLKEEAGWLKSQLEAINLRIEELEKK
jgi:hypothetical protein